MNTISCMLLAACIAGTGLATEAAPVIPPPTPLLLDRLPPPLEADESSGKRTAAPIAGAEVLFDGDDLDAWRTRDGDPATWTIEPGGVLAVRRGAGDIITRAPHGDLYLHVEFLVPRGGDPGQSAGNSGIKFQECYELQILDAEAGSAPTRSGIGSIYAQKASDHTHGVGTSAWQRYDVWFTAPVWEGDRKISEARMTVYLNGRLAHDDVALPKATGASTRESHEPRGLLLQDHHSTAPEPVRFRSIWTLRPPAFDPAAPWKIAARRGEMIDVPAPSTGGPVGAFTVAPPLPPGLTLDLQRGRVHGRATQAGVTDHVVTATNSVAAASTPLTITISSP